MNSETGPRGGRLLILCCSQMQEKAEWFWFSHIKAFALLPNSWGVGMSGFCLFLIGFSRGLSAPGKGQLQKTPQFPQHFRQTYDPRVSHSGHGHCIKGWNGQAVLSTTSVGTLPSGTSLPLSHFSVLGQRTASSWGNFFQGSPPGLFFFVSAWQRDGRDLLLAFQGRMAHCGSEFFLKGTQQQLGDCFWNSNIKAERNSLQCSQGHKAVSPLPAFKIVSVATVLPLSEVCLQLPSSLDSLMPVWRELSWAYPSSLR